MMATMNGNGENGRSLPDGWERSTVAKSVKNIPLTGKKLPQRDYLETGKIPVVDQGQKFIGGYTDLDELVVKCELPVIIFGDHTKAIKFVTMPFVAGADGIKVLKPLERFNPKLLYYFLQAVDLPDKGYARHFQYLEKAEIPVPPLPEQERIVSRIEELFSDLEVGVASLERVRVGLERYKASVLKSACEGRLLANEQVENTGELPEGWTWTTVEELNPPNRKCAYGVLQPGVDKEDGILFIRVGDINDGRIDLQNLKRIDPEIAAKYPRTKLQGGEVLITLVGAIGRTAVVPESLAGANTARAVGVIPIKDGIHAPWVEIWFRNTEKVIEMTSKAHEVARKTLNLEDVRAAKVALPPLDEQRRIVAEVERRLSVVGEVESAVEVGLARSARLRQSVLRSAFEGRL